MLFNQLIAKLKERNIEIQEYHLSTNPEIIKGASIEKALSNEISFLEIGNILKNQLNKTTAGALLLPPDEKLCEIARNKSISWAKLKNPRLGFAETLDILNPRKIFTEEVHETAVISANVSINKGVHIGAHVYIGANCSIGSNTVIHPGVIINDDVSIGDNSELNANCVIHDGTKIGDNCVVNSNSVIGSEGFGFVPTNKGWRKMPQTGIVILEDDVEIGSGCTIDRPAVGETVIGKGTKIDNLVQVGHGVSIGKHCAMAAQVGIAGGAKIGKGVILAGQVGVGNRVKVGDGVIASSKCGIHADVAPGEVISGFPALPNKLWLRCSANFKKLPEIAKAIREMSKLTSM